MGKRWEIVLAGTGGQGLIMAGILLGAAATQEGYDAAQTQSYGIATRGGVSFSEVVISDREIIYPRTTMPDVILALTEETFHMFYQEENLNNLMIYDEDRIRWPKERKNVVGLPLTKCCREIGNPGVINLLGLGAVVGFTGIIPVRAMDDTIKTRFPKNYDQNLAAFKKGFHLAILKKS